LGFVDMKRAWNFEIDSHEYAEKAKMKLNVSIRAEAIAIYRGRSRGDDLSPEAAFAHYSLLALYFPTEFSFDSVRSYKLHLKLNVVNLLSMDF
jgi:hypothetical protein